MSVHAAAYSPCLRGPHLFIHAGITSGLRMLTGEDPRMTRGMLSTAIASKALRVSNVVANIVPRKDRVFQAAQRAIVIDDVADVDSAILAGE